MTAAPNNARLIAELQAASLGIRFVGLARLPEVMIAGAISPAGYAGRQAEVSPLKHRTRP